MIQEITQEITLGDLFEKFGMLEQGEYIPKFDLEVLTPDGFRKVNALLKTQPNPEWEIELESGKKSIFADFHRIEVEDNEDEIDVNRKWKFVKNLKVGDEVKSKNGNQKIKSVSFNGKYSEMFDLQVEENKCFYTDDLVSHNTLILGNFAIQAFLQGKKALVYSFEVSDARLLQRYFSNFLRKTKTQMILNEEETKQQMKDYVADKEGDLKLKVYQPNTVCSHDLMAHINDLDQYENWKPDIIIVDYILIMRPNDSRMTSDDSYHYFKRVAEDLRSLGTILNIPIVSAVQTNRDGMDDAGGSKALTTSKQVAESRGILDTADFFATINQTARQKTKSEIMIYADKNRNGGTGEKIYCEVDYNYMLLQERVPTTAEIKS